MLKHRKIEIVINHDPMFGSQKCYFVCAYYPRGTSLQNFIEIGRDLGVPPL
jgi:hypothetical protein